MAPVICLYFFLSTGMQQPFIKSIVIVQFPLVCTSAISYYCFFYIFAKNALQ